MPINYNNGKIYKIIDNNNEIIYIGSTAQEKLCDRFKNHKHRGNGNKIVLLELCPCSCKEELFMKEQEVIEQYENLLNQKRAFNSEEYNKEKYKKWCEINKEKMKEYKRKQYKNNKEYHNEYNKEYYVNNKEKMKEYKRNHYQENKDKINEQHKKWTDNNKEKMKEYHKKWYEENRNKISEKNKVKVICGCGCEILKSNMIRHKQSKKHIDLMNTIKV